jgi:Helicase conserved C-terminal domain
VSVGYAEFLATKHRHASEHGSPVEPGELHPGLYPWQREAVAWALRKGRCALFWDCGLGKTFAQVEWARHSAEKALILAPLSVARQTVREAARIDADVRYVRAQSEVAGLGLWITNYEMADRFDPSEFGAVVLDESSILKNVDGKTRRALTARFSTVPHRLACTATPAPNDVAELTNHAEFLGVMSRAEMLAAYFINDEKSWRLKGHATEAMFAWMASWAQALRTPADMGYPDDEYRLPELGIVQETVRVDLAPSDGQLFAGGLGGIGGRARVRRETLSARVARANELATGHEQVIVWCGLNDEARGCAAAIEGSVNVEGSWTPDAKATALESFQDGEFRVLVTKPSIAGFGMNFQQCHRMIFVGLGDSYESYYQAIRRCWRFGQEHAVDVRIVVSEIEQQIVSNVKAKEREARRWTAGLIAAMHGAAA